MGRPLARQKQMAAMQIEPRGLVKFQEPPVRDSLKRQRKESARSSSSAAYIYRVDPIIRVFFAAVLYSVEFKCENINILWPLTELISKRRGYACVVCDYSVRSEILCAET